MFPVGTRVRISKIGRKEYYNNESNPYNQVGTLIAADLWDDEEFPYKVLWAKSITNIYRPEDLDVAEPITEEMIKELI